MHPCFTTYDAGQMRHWWEPLLTILCFPVAAQRDWLMYIPLGERKTHTWSVTHCSTWSAIPPYAAACAMTCKYTSYPYPSTTFAYNGWFSKVCHDGCDDRPSVSGPNTNALISISIVMLDEGTSWVLNAHSTRVSSHKSLLCYFRNGFWRSELYENLG